jgi:hypothetical protein
VFLGGTDTSPNTSRQALDAAAIPGTDTDALRSIRNAAVYTQFSRLLDPWCLQYQQYRQCPALAARLETGHWRLHTAQLSSVMLNPVGACEPIKRAVSSRLQLDCSHNCPHTRIWSRGFRHIPRLDALVVFRSQVTPGLSISMRIRPICKSPHTCSYITCTRPG